MNRIETFQRKLFKNQTKPEILLYKHLVERFRDTQSKFRFPLMRRQMIIGHYIVDFVFLHKHLIIELDGNQHFSLDGQADDILRDAYLKRLGFDILRYRNRDVVRNIDDIVDYIDLWASFENPLSNYFCFKGIVRRQNKLRKRNRLKRQPKAKDCL